MAEPTQELQSETGEAERQTHSLFRDSSSVALQTLTDLVELEVVTTVRRLAAQKHSVALAQLASRISANKKFGVGADEDPGASLRSRGPTAPASEEQTSCMNLAVRFDRNVAAVLIGSKTFYHDAVNSVWQHKQVDWSGQGHVSD